MGIELNDVVFDLTSGPPAIPATPSGLARWDPGTGTLYISDGALWNDVTGATPAPVTPVRTKLSTATDFYLDDATGMDTNDGLTPGTAWKTLASAAFQLSTEYDFGGQSVTLNIANGTYDEVGAARFDNLIGGGSLTLEGNLGDPTAVLIRYPSFITGLTIINSGVNVTLNSITFAAQPAATPIILVAILNSRTDVNNCRFDGTGLLGSAITYSVNAFGTGAGTIEFFNDHVIPVLISNHSSLDWRSITIDFSTAVNITTAVFDLRDHAGIQLNSTIFANPGNVTGVRFEARENSHIDTGTNDLTFIPGTIAGMIESGSTYDNIGNLSPNTASIEIGWKPSIPNDGNGIYANFADAHAALIASNALRKTLVIEDFGVTVPTGSWDMSNIIVRGSLQNSAIYSVSFDIGAEWRNPLQLRDLNFSNAGAIDSWIVYNTDLETIYDNVLINGRVAPPLIEIDGSCSVFLELQNSTLSNTGGPAINYGFALFINAFGQTTIGTNAIDIESSGPLQLNIYDQSVRVFEPQLNGDVLYEEKFIVHRNRFDVTGAGTTFAGTLVAGNIILENTASATEIFRLNGTELPGTSTTIHLTSDSIGNVAVENSASIVLTTLLPGSSVSLTWDETDWIIHLPIIRERLIANRTYYIDPLGSDENDGLTPGTPFATLAKVFELLENNIDGANYNVIASMANGTYTMGFPIASNVGIAQIGTLTIQGNTSDPTAVVIDPTVNFLQLSGYGRVILDSITIDNSGFASQVVAVGDVSLTFTNVRFVGPLAAAFAISYIEASDNARLNVNGFLEFTHGLPFAGSRFIGLANYACFEVLSTGEIRLPVGSISATQFIFISNEATGKFINATITNPGSLTGKRFTISGSGGIEASPSDLNLLPGTLDGTLEDVGYYSNLTGLEINNKISGFTLTGGGAPGAAGFTGEAQYDEINDILYIYDGTTWNPH